MTRTPNPAQVNTACGLLARARAEQDGDPRLPLSEVVGPVFHGEGPFTGVRTRRIRLGHGIADPDHPAVDVDQILTRAAAVSAPVTVLTGEPLLLQGSPAFAYLLTMLRDLGAVHVDTTGTVEPGGLVAALVDHYTVSPLLASSGLPLLQRINLRALEWFARHAAQHRATVAFRFPVRDVDQLREVDSMVSEFGIDRAQVWVQPESDDQDVLLAQHRALADEVLARGYHTSTRLHVLLQPKEAAAPS